MDEEDDNETVSRFLSDLESIHHAGAGDTDHCPAISEASLRDLQSILDGAAGRPRRRRRGRADDDGEDASAALLWELLAARGLQVSALLRPLSAAMDSASAPRLTLVAARAYLSLLLCPSAPLYSLFNPLSFLSLLRALRRSLKAQNPSPAPGVSSTSDPLPGGRKNARKRKPGRVRDAVSSSSPPSAERRAEVADLLTDALELLDAVLARVRLDAFPDGVKPLVETLVGIIESTAGHNRLPELCFRILYSVVSRPDHGDQTISAVEVLRTLTPIILHSAKSPLRSTAVAYVTRKLVPLGRENDGVRKAVAYLPRFLATKAPEKSEPRACAVDSILEVVHAMEQDEQCGFASYVVKMTQGKAQMRLLSVDLILALLTSLPSPGVIDQSSEDTWMMECLKALVQRCSDSLGGIRARALINLGQAVAFLSANQDAHARLREVIGIDNAKFIELLRRRCQDDKAAVRKAALLLITRLTALIGGPIDELLLKTMGNACTDSLVSIRKAAIGALSEVFRKYPDERVLAEWLHAVPRLIVDNETSIQDECENLFLELVLDRISRAVKIRLREDTTELMSILPEGTLDLLKGTCDGEVALCIQKICASLGKKKKLKSSVTGALQNIISMSESLWMRSFMPIEKWVAPPGSWQLLSEVSLFTPKAVEWEFLLHHWQLLDKSNREDLGEIHDEEEPNSCTWAANRVSLLQTISNVSLELPSEPAAELASNLLEYLKDFNMHFSEVDAHVKALKTLCKRKALKPEEGDALVVKWVHQLLSKALDILDNFVTGVSERGRANTFLTPPQSSKAKGKKEASSSKSILQSATAVFTIGSLVLACPSADLQGIVPLLHTIITSENSEPKPKKLAGLTASFKEVAPTLYIQSWVTMGKICLVDDKLAKRYIPLFVQELERSDIAALRNNIMVIMTDFCVRYTALVDCYIPKITKSLRDSCEVVRRQTFILLSRLLQRDYVKWRGVLFLRFLLSLVDESEKIRHLADYLFGSILKAKAPLLAYNSFIEAVFILNDCHAHAAHSDTQGSTHRGPQLFSIRGNDEKSRSQRMHIYVSLLKQMAPEHLLATSAKLCAEILAAASDGLLNIDNATGQAVLQDALQLLSCKEMRIHPSRASDTSEMDDEGGDGGGSAALAAVKGRVVTQVAKKNLIQIAVPIFIELKRLLESKNSPLTGCLMECLRTLLKDFKNEIEEILVGDKQLQKELLYDMQKYEAAKARSTVAETVATMQRSENNRSPNGLSAVVYTKVSEKLGTGGKIGSAVADAAARAKARSVLKEVNQNVPTPPLHTMSVPRLKTAADGDRVGSRDRPSDILESVRRRQSFESDEDN